MITEEQLEQVTVRFPNPLETGEVRNLLHKISTTVPNSKTEAEGAFRRSGESLAQESELARAVKFRSFSIFRESAGFTRIISFDMKTDYDVHAGKSFYTAMRYEATPHTFQDPNKTTLNVIGEVRSAVDSYFAERRSQLNFE